MMKNGSSGERGLIIQTVREVTLDYELEILAELEAVHFGQVGLWERALDSAV